MGTHVKRPLQTLDKRWEVLDKEVTQVIYTRNHNDGWSSWLDHIITCDGSKAYDRNGNVICDAEEIGTDGTYLVARNGSVATLYLKESFAVEAGSFVEMGEIDNVMQVVGTNVLIHRGKYAVDQNSKAIPVGKVYEASSVIFGADYDATFDDDNVIAIYPVGNKTMQITLDNEVTEAIACEIEWRGGVSYRLTESGVFKKLYEIHDGVATLVDSGVDAIGIVSRVGDIAAARNPYGLTRNSNDGNSNWQKAFAQKAQSHTIQNTLWGWQHSNGVQDLEFFGVSDVVYDDGCPQTFVYVKGDKAYYKDVTEWAECIMMSDTQSAWSDDFTVQKSGKPVVMAKEIYTTRFLETEINLDSTPRTIPATTL